MWIGDVVRNVDDVKLLMAVVPSAFSTLCTSYFTKLRQVKVGAIAMESTTNQIICHGFIDLQC